MITEDFVGFLRRRKIVPHVAAGKSGSAGGSMVQQVGIGSYSMSCGPDFKEKS